MVGFIVIRPGLMLSFSSLQMPQATSRIAHISHGTKLHNLAVGQRNRIRRQP